ncbi:MAG: HNH endonuclease [Treponema sp.]
MKNVRDAVNKIAGEDYRKNYFDAYPKGPYVCKGCGKVFKTRAGCTIDHIVPRAFGGTNDRANLQILCEECNQRKGSKIDGLTAKYAGDALLRELKKLLHY